MLAAKTERYRLGEPGTGAVSKHRRAAAKSRPLDMIAPV